MSSKATSQNYLWKVDILIKNWPTVPCDVTQLENGPCVVYLSTRQKSMNCQAAPLLCLIKVPYQPELSVEGQVLYPPPNSSTVRSSDHTARTFCQKLKELPRRSTVLLTKRNISVSAQSRGTSVQNCSAVPWWSEVNLPAGTLSWESTLQHITVQQHPQVMQS